MESTFFAELLRKNLVQENNQLYQSILFDTIRSSVSDPYWKDVIKLFDQLNSDQREILFSIFNQVQIDAISNVLGIIDGVNFIEDIEGEFELFYDKKELDKNLQSDFLELFE